MNINVTRNHTTFFNFFQMFWWYIHHQYWTSSCTRETCSVHSIYNIAYLDPGQKPYFIWGELIWVLLMWSMVFDLGLKQHAKKVMSHSPGLVDFAIGLVNCRGKFKLQQDCNQSSSSFFFWKGWGASFNDHWASTCYLQLAQMASCKADFLCTL